MNTISAEGWGALWEGDLGRYDPQDVLTAVDTEQSSVRCQKIVAYLRAHLGDLSGRRTIEIGCGGALYSLIFARLGARAALLDYSPEALTLAARNLRAAGLQGELLQEDAFDLPPDHAGRYDVAMSFGTVEHYRYPQRLEICRSHVELVRPGGVVIVSTPNVNFLPHEILKRLLQARGKWFLGYEGSFSRWEFFRVARALGLQHVQIAGSSWTSDLRRYIDIVRDTRTYRKWVRLGAPKPERSSPVQSQRCHWLDDYLGHDIVLLGIKPSIAESVA